MIFETIKSEGLAHFSYMIGDENAGICAVIDPRRDGEVYIELARQKDVRIAYILETHLHADFVSGSRELAARTGASTCSFPHNPPRDGDRIQLGSLILEVIRTPGHTPEHVCYLISGGAGAQAPWGIFTGDTLFAGEVGRPDLLGEDTEKELAQQLYHSLHDKLLKLEGDLIIYPAHGEGSPCGTSIGDRPTSTIGYERRQNPLLQVKDPAKFVQELLASLSPAPSYYSRVKKINARGPQVLGSWPYLKPLEAAEFQEEMKHPKTVVLDSREIEAFGGGHIPGAINIGLREAFPIWAGRILDEIFPISADGTLDPESGLLLVLSDTDKADTVLRHLLRIGYENIQGYLRQGMRGWFDAGLPFDRVSQMSVHELKEHLDRKDNLQVLDVRADEEWVEGHIPTARHIFVPHLKQSLEQLDRSRPVITYCGSGYRASIAASLLQRHSFEEVYNVPGSMDAWKAAGYPLEGVQKQA